MKGVNLRKSYFKKFKIFMPGSKICVNSTDEYFMYFKDSQFKIQKTILEIYDNKYSVSYHIEECGEGLRHRPRIAFKNGNSYIVPIDDDCKILNELPKENIQTTYNIGGTYYLINMIDSLKYYSPTTVKLDFKTLKIEENNKFSEHITFKIIGRKNKYLSLEYNENDPKNFIIPGYYERRFMIFNEKEHKIKLLEEKLKRL